LVVLDQTECIAIGSNASRRRRAGDAAATGAGTIPGGEGWKNTSITAS
jgi:hypothetical protein